MNIIVNNKQYSHITTELKRKATINYSSNTGETIANTLSLDPTSTRLSYTLTFDSMFKDQESLENLWNDLIVPRIEGISVVMPYNKTEISFKAKVNEIEQGYVTTIDGERIWDKINVTFESTTPLLGVD